jgi:hypothetical protein
MSKRQFHILYREFLFRLMDVELLSASAAGDSSGLAGQCGALLIAGSVLLSWIALATTGLPHRPEALAAVVWSWERRLVSLTMLAVGLFAVLSWDSTFLDRRDVLVLAPLPVRGRTLLAAKIAASAAALGLTVAALNILSAFAWPQVLAPPGTGVGGILRFVAAFWIAMFAAGTFLYGAVLAVHGAIAQLPRRWYLRASSFLQMAAFTAFVGVFLLQPSFATARALGATANQRLLAWLPPYWFMGLLSELSGAFRAQGHAVMAPLARRALAGLAIAIFFATAAFLLSYFRSLRKIVEVPDIVPGARGGVWLPRFGNSPATALAQFAIRTLLRSRQHRVILAFYLGIGFALATLYMQMPASQRFLSMLAASIVMLCAWVLGTRVVFGLPLELKSNWVFRLMPLRGVPAALPAARRALLGIGAVPVWVACAVFFLWRWPWPGAAAHLLVLALVASILADIALRGFRKIPFTCSYLPGKSNVHIIFWLSVMLLIGIVLAGAELERNAMARPWTYGLMVALLVGGAAGARWLTQTYAQEEGAEIQFEETLSDAVLVLGLQNGPVIVQNPPADAASPRTMGA